MSGTVRPANPSDASAIRAVHVAAFPTGLEADLVEQLERDGDAVISLVAEEESGVVGHVLMSRMRANGSGRDLRALGLAPVAVLPARQRSGIGGALIVDALALAEQDGEEIVFVLGDPDYYGRFGFSAPAAAPFRSPYAGPHLMARWLNGGERPASGRADYAPAFAGLE